MTSARTLKRDVDRVGETLNNLRWTMIEHGFYLNEVNRERDRYLAGFATVDEFEARLDHVLGLDR